MDSLAVKEWLSYSRMDLASAKHLCSMHPKPLEIICYHSQQGAEKALKAYWVFNDITPQKTHDLEILRSKCEESDISFEELFDECNRLNLYSSQPRYPFGLELTDKITQLAIDDCERVVTFISEKVLQN